MVSGVSRNRHARTGAPACASTALTPTVRKSVLLPDMFDPLTTSTRRSGLAVMAARKASVGEGLLGGLRFQRTDIQSPRKPVGGG